jgi:hypothetical protein
MSRILKAAFFVRTPQPSSLSATMLVGVIRPVPRVQLKADVRVDKRQKNGNIHTRSLHQLNRDIHWNNVPREIFDSEYRSSLPKRAMVGRKRKNNLCRTCDEMATGLLALDNPENAEEIHQHHKVCEFRSIAR